MSTGEIWRMVPSLPGLLASSFGRVKVAPHRRPLPWGGSRMYGGTPRGGSWDGQRMVYQRRGAKTLKVARLVCEAFNGPPPFDGAVCMHLNENARDNRPENLAWGTQRENLNAPGFLAYCRSRTGDNNPFVKGRRKTQLEAERKAA